MDVLADLLSRARASGSLFAETVLHGRGGVTMPSELAPLAIHVVSRGRLWAHVDGVQRQLSEGDVLLVRAPTELDVTAGAGERPRPLATLLAATGDSPEAPAAGVSAAGAPGVRRLDLPGEGPEAALLCGAYSLRGTVCDRLLDALPPLVHVPAASAPHELRTLLQLLAVELAGDAPGQQTALDRLLDLVLVHVLRAHLAATGATGGAVPPWYAALADPGVGAAVRALHTQPARPWTVARLAREAGQSRATFARRFTTLVGEPPMTYLTAWRMALAQDALRSGGTTLAAIAREVGYGSEYALSAAFTRHVGEAPSRWRARVAGAAQPSAPVGVRLGPGGLPSTW